MGLASKASSVLIRDLFLLGSTLCTSVVIARKLGPEIMGIYVIINMIPSYAEMFGRSKVELSAVYFLGKEKYQLGDVISSLNLIALITSVLLILLIVVFFPSLSTALLKDDVDAYSNYLLVILAVIPINLFYLNYMYLHIHNEDVRSVNFMILVRALGMSVLAVPGLLFFDFLIPELVGTYIFSYILALIVGVFRLDRWKRDGPLINIPLIKDFFTYAYSVYIAGVLVNLNTYIANTLILFIAAPAQIALYALAQQFSQLLLKVTDSLNVFLFPSVAKKDVDEAKFYVAKAFRTAMVLMLPIGIASAFFIYPAIYILYGLEFIPIVYPFLILLLGVISSSISSTLLMYFMGIGRPDIITKTLIIPVLIQLSFGYWLVVTYGLNGAAVTLSIGMIVAGIAQVLTFSRLSGLSFSEHLIFKREDFLTVANFVRMRLKI